METKIIDNISEARKPKPRKKHSSPVGRVGTSVSEAFFLATEKDEDTPETWYRQKEELSKTFRKQITSAPTKSKIIDERNNSQSDGSNGDEVKLRRGSRRGSILTNSDSHLLQQCSTIGRWKIRYADMAECRLDQPRFNRRRINRCNTMPISESLLRNLNRQRGIAVDDDISPLRAISTAGTVQEVAHQLLGLGQKEKEKVKWRLSRRRGSILARSAESMGSESPIQRILRLKSSIASIEAEYRRLKRPSILEPTMRAVVEEITQTTMEHQAKFKRKDEAMAFFRKVSRVVIYALRWINFILQIGEDKRALHEQLKSFTDLAVEIENSNPMDSSRADDLAFDKNYYKAKKEITLSSDVRRILSIRSDVRTPEMLKQVLHGLQNLQSLAEYPLHIQETLCKVAWYQQLEAKRVIVREGHIAENFYLILSGQAFVKRMFLNEQTGESEIRTVARLGRGQNFGEVALLKESTRTATVESATTVELLSIGHDDFARIFTRRQCSDGQPEHVKFLKQVPLFDGWPMEKVIEEPSHCIMHYFKHGSVVTENDQNSEWIYVVKGGHCEVVKKLHSVKARSPKEARRLREYEKEASRARTFPPDQLPRIDDRQQATSRSIHVASPVYDVMTQCLSSGRQGVGSKAGRRVSFQATALPRRHGPVSKKPTFKTEISSPAPGDGETLQVLDVGSMVDNLPRVVSTPVLPLVEITGDNDSSKSKSKFQDFFPRLATSHMRSSNSSGRVNFKRRPTTSVEPVKQQMNETTSVFVSVEILRPKDIFGLDTLNLTELPCDSESKVYVVSHGAEVVMFSRKFFMKYANEHVQRMVKQNARAYPCEEKLQENLQLEADWAVYRKSVVADFVERKSHMKTLLPVL